MEWNKTIAQWNLGNRLYLSVPFTWNLPEAYWLAKQHKGSVFAGGPAVDLLPGYLADVATIGTESPIPPLMMHNPLATFTTRGCPNKCSFCAVPKIEGGFHELESWENRPIICDNNLLESSRKHFGKVIDGLKLLGFADFNQGLDARKFNRYHASRIAEIKQPLVRFAFDHVNSETKVHDAIELARSEGIRNFHIYVLIGYKDTPTDALYRLEKVREWGIRPNPMRYQPLDALRKNEYIAPGWTKAELKRMVRYYSRLRWLEHIPFNEYSPDKQTELFK